MVFQKGKRRPRRTARSLITNTCPGMHMQMSAGRAGDQVADTIAEDGGAYGIRTRVTCMGSEGPECGRAKADTPVRAEGLPDSD